MERAPIPTGITAGGVVAIARRPDRAAIPAIVDALAEGGIGTFELTLNEPEDDALRAIEAAAAHVRRQVGSSVGAVAIGAGTVLSIDAARRAIDAGASFLVCPHLDVELVGWAIERRIPVLPGAATPTEVHAAWRAGASAVKVFPASSVGASFLRELHGPFPDIPLLPTGGITVETLGDFIRAGAMAVGLGSWLFAGGVPAISERARMAIAAVAAARDPAIG
jgi:2-dehydro-3-deoxyphosphogluconate aldolase/(4S)-4-hydroxy-2-oxoglutarate aldolase